MRITIPRILRPFSLDGKAILFQYAHREKPWLRINAFLPLSPKPLYNGVAMILRFHLADDQYPFRGIRRKRIAVRAFLRLPDGRYLFNRVTRDDAFGKESYLETVGGGRKKGESFSEALRREVEEETGYQIDEIRYLGCVTDAYNLIHQKNETHYFEASVLPHPGKRHLESRGDRLIEASLPLSLQAAKDLYETSPEEGVSLLVRRREIPFVEELLAGVKRRSFIESPKMAK